ncbi:MAG TPA: hypothetical protein DDW50_09455 [Firmicutes bacterium]|jgi:hypothetical protein|nr:hypothetical protein [Bacillota bacterium]
MVLDYYFKKHHQNKLADQFSFLQNRLTFAGCFFFTGPLSASTICRERFFKNKLFHNGWIYKIEAFFRVETLHFYCINDI